MKKYNLKFDNNDRNIIRVSKEEIEEAYKEQEDIRKVIKGLESSRAKLTNMDLVELNRLKSREQALTRHVMSLGYKVKESATLQIEKEEIVNKLKTQGIDITAEELLSYI